MPDELTHAALEQPYTWEEMMEHDIPTCPWCTLPTYGLGDWHPDCEDEYNAQQAARDKHFEEEAPNG